MPELRPSYTPIYHDPIFDLRETCQDLDFRNRVIEDDGWAADTSPLKRLDFADAVAAHARIQGPWPR